MTKRAAVIGHPISHSKSPLIHNYWLKKYRIDGKYEAIDVSPENLRSEISNLIEKNYVGFNVTIPHKEEMYNLCECDEIATDVAAVNTVVIKNGKLYGTNTDGFGFIENIRANKPDFKFQDSKVVIWGAGGAARAIGAALIKQGVSEIFYINRTYSRAKALADDLGFGEAYPWENRNSKLKNADMLIHTTSQGMTGKDKLQFDITDLPRSALVTDIVYSPLMTDLLKAAQKKGNPVLTGIGMLLHQARPAFKEWFGVMPDVDKELEELVLR